MDGRPYAGSDEVGPKTLSLFHDDLTPADGRQVSIADQFSHKSHYSTSDQQDAMNRAQGLRPHTRVATVETFVAPMGS